MNYLWGVICMKEIYLNGFNEDQIHIIQLIGLDNYLKLCEAFAGESIYIPKMKSAKIIERNKKIKSEFNGKNLYYLSQKYHICVRQVRRILKT